MIATIRHKGLRRLYERGETRGVSGDQIKRLRRILILLDNAASLDDLDAMPGMRLHPKTGDLKGMWSLSVTGNWRVVFRFDDGDVNDVDLLDYH